MVSLFVFNVKHKQDGGHVRAQRRFLKLVVVACVLLVAMVFPSACTHPQAAREREQIIAYFDEMTPVMEAYMAYMKKWKAFGWPSDIPPIAEATPQLEDFRSQSQKLYENVENSVPPPILVNFKSKWLEECYLLGQCTAMTLWSFNHGSSEYAHRGPDLLNQTNAAHSEWSGELADLLSRYDIEWDIHSSD